MLTHVHTYIIHTLHVNTCTHVPIKHHVHVHNRMSITIISHMQSTLAHASTHARTHKHTHTHTHTYLQTPTYPSIQSLNNYFFCVFNFTQLFYYISTRFCCKLYSVLRGRHRVKHCLWWRSPAFFSCKISNDVRLLYAICHVMFYVLLLLE